MSLLKIHTFIFFRLSLQLNWYKSNKALISCFNLFSFFFLLLVNLFFNISVFCIILFIYLFIFFFFLFDFQKQHHLANFHWHRGGGEGGFLPLHPCPSPTVNSFNLFFSLLFLFNFYVFFSSCFWLLLLYIFLIFINFYFLHTYNNY